LPAASADQSAQLKIAAEGKVVKNRPHLDVRVGTGLVGEERLAALEAEWARLVALGAVRVRLLPADDRGHRTRSDEMYKNLAAIGANIRWPPMEWDIGRGQRRRLPRKMRRSRPRIIVKIAISKPTRPGHGNRRPTSSTSYTSSQLASAASNVASAAKPPRGRCPPYR
jgi:hypothetical protein